MFLYTIYVPSFTQAIIKRKLFYDKLSSLRRSNVPLPPPRYKIQFYQDKYEKN